VETHAGGQYSMTLPEGIYALTAGPLPPGYPDPTTVPDIQVTAGLTTEQSIPLTPMPYLVEGTVMVDDSVPGGNNNGYPEPGESGLLLWESLSNIGAATATNVTAHLTSLTPGVTVTVADAPYPDIPVGETLTSVTPFEFSIDSTVPCGTKLDFEKAVTTDEGTFTVAFGLFAKVPLPPELLFSDEMENGAANWTTGGTNNRWAITEEQSFSPTHAWSDSPNGSYLDNTNAWLRSPILDLGVSTDVTLSFWHRFALEAGWDYGYVEYSLDGGTTWQPTGTSYTGPQDTWSQQTLAMPAFAGQPQAAFRFRIQSDGGVTADGWYIDDVDLSYVPFTCYPPAQPTIHVHSIQGFFTLDPYGRSVLRMHVAVHDSQDNPQGYVTVTSSIWWPNGGPVQRARVTKPTGYARFPWGSSVPGLWKLCVDDLTKTGYIYDPGQNVETCHEWNN